MTLNALVTTLLCYCHLSFAILLGSGFIPPFHTSQPNELVIVQLDSDNIDLIRNDTWLVLTTTPWCPFSSNLSNTWISFLKNISSTAQINLSTSFVKQEDNKTLLLPPKLKIASLNADEYPDIAALLEIRAYPSIKIVDEGMTFSMAEKLTIGSLYQFVCERGYKRRGWASTLLARASLIYQYQLSIFNFFGRYFHHVLNELRRISQQRVLPDDGSFL